jgi:SlyX protein
MSEDRLIDIETKLAHQDQLLFELNVVVTEQQARIMQLEQMGTSLLARIREIGAAQPDDRPQDERPPHY